MPVTHELKTWPETLQSIRIGNKTFELRYNDRDFHVGDRLLLRGWEPETEEYTGEQLLVEVIYMYCAKEGDTWGLLPGYCCMSIKIIKE